MTEKDDDRVVVLTELHEATRRMMSAESVDEVGTLVRDAAARLVDVPLAAVYLTETDDLVTGSTGTVPPELEDDIRRTLRDAIDQDAPLLRELDASPDTSYSVVARGMGDRGALLVADTGVSFTDKDIELVRILTTNGEVALDRAIQLCMLRDREADLLDERNRLAALFENIPSPTASFVIEGDEPVVESINPAFESVFGYTQETLEGEQIDDYIVPPGRESEASEYNDLLKQGQNINVEVRRLTTEGPRDFLLDVVPFRLNERNVHGYAMYTDITERKHREQELERQNERLDKFASIVSHDIRNPVNVAQGFLDLARENPQEEYFDRVDDALDRVDDIVESVLALARQGQTVTEPTPTNLADTAASAWRNVATDGATLEVQDDADRELLGDETRLITLFENLFRNSVVHGTTDGTDADGEHEPGVSVTVGVLPDESGFFVMDDGPGIPADVRDRVFQSGFTTRENGTGFGLAIVKEVVEAHDWTIDVADDAAGARFEIRDVRWADDEAAASG